MKCPRCLNEDENLFALGSKGIYCRACISFKRQILLEEKVELSRTEINVKADYELPFILSEDQRLVSEELCKQIQTNNVLLYAVCGAGKTEILLEVIKKTLNENKKVAIAIPRRQVVLELKERLSTYFKDNKVIAICQGYTDDLEGDLIVCTTHQLYRFYQEFDLLILDEPDAFPYKGNKVLQGISQTACKGKTIYSTATPDGYIQGLVESGECVEVSLHKRPHGFPLIVPKLKVRPKFIGFLELMLFLNDKCKENRQVMIFCATIAQAHTMTRVLKFKYNVSCCTSKSVEKDEIIESFRSGQIQFLICTTILERGVTFKSVDVIVVSADHDVFDEASLVQISGRVGRKKEDPYGDCLFLATSYSKVAKSCIQRIKDSNKALSVVSSK